MSNIQIIPGAEPIFLEGREGNDIGCIVLHGFTSTPQVVRAYAVALAREGGFTVSAPLLSGHGTEIEDLIGITMHDWVRDVLRATEELEKTCSKIFITGQSLGAILSLYMAAMYPDRFAGVIPINGAVLFGDADRVASLFSLDAPGEIPNDEPDTKKPNVDEIYYSAMPTPAFHQVYLLLSVTHTILKRLKTPILIMQAREDHLLAPKNGPYMMDNVGSKDKRLLWLEDSYHVATLDYDLDIIIDEAIEFIRTRAELKGFSVDLEELSFFFNNNGFEASHYLDMQTGAVVTVTLDMRFTIERIYGEYNENELQTDEQLEAALMADGTVQKWDVPQLIEAIRVEREFETRYLEIPSITSSDAYHDMEDFIEMVDDRRVQRELWRAINGRGAFRRFKDVLLDFPEERDDWFEFKKNKMRNRVIDWLSKVQNANKNI
ncbi:MAG: UPF0158 family protein [Chloroflexota bacterium]